MSLTKERTTAKSRLNERLFSKTNRVKTTCLSLLALLVVVCIVFSSITFGSVGGISNHYSFSSWNSAETGYETVIFKNKKSNQKIDRIWLYLTAGDFSSGEENVNVYLHYSYSENGTYYATSAKELSVENQPSAFGKWYVMENLSISSSYTYYELGTNDVIKIGEVIFVTDGGEKASVEIVNAGFATNFNTKSNYTHLSSYGNEEKANKANKLIDEQSKFNLANAKTVDGKLVYETADSEKYLESEFSLLTSVINFAENGGNYVDSSFGTFGYQLIALSTLIFGTNVFALRILPMLFSLATVVLVYFMAKLLFKKDTYGLLASFITVLFGYLLALSNKATIEPIFTFFILLTLYFAFKFYVRGVSDNDSVKGYTNLAFCGAFFALSLVTSARALVMLIPVSAVFVMGLVRQYKAYKYKLSHLTDAQSVKVCKENYKRKLTLSITCFVSSAILFSLLSSFVLTAVSMGALTSVYQTNDVFYIVGEIIRGAFGKVSSNNLISPASFVVNCGVQNLGNGNYVFGNVIISILGLFSVCHSLTEIIYAFVSKNKEITFNAKVQYLLIIGCFITAYIVPTFTAISGVSSYLLASVLTSFVLLQSVQIFESYRQKTLVVVKGYKITVFRIIMGALLLFALVNLGLSVSGYFGYGANTAIYSWNAMGKF